MQGRKKLTAAEKAKREARRATAAPRDAEPAPAGPTLGQVIAREDLVRIASKSTRQLIAAATAHVEESARASQRAVSCHTCAAAKGCCKLTVTLLLHEAVPIVARLRADGRDTPALRAALAEAAALMESRSQAEYRELRRPCALLDADERCTVYEQRPRECGSAFVFSPPEQCSDPAATTVEMVRPPKQGVLEQLGRTERAIEQAARLPRLDGVYMAVLPRMVLLVLEAWDREDYAGWLAAEVPPAIARMVAATERR